MSIYLQRAVKLPSLPNYLRFEQGEDSIDIADLPDATLQEIGKAWTVALVEMAEERRRRRKAADA